MIQSFPIPSSPTLVVGDTTTKDAAVVDPGDVADQIQKIISDQNFKVRAVLITISDLVHASRAAELRNKYQVPVIARESHLHGFMRLPAEAERAGLCGVKVPIVDRFMKPGDQLDFGSLRVFVLEKNGKLEFRIESVDAKFGIT